MQSKIVCGNCLVEMCQLEPNSIDLCLTDPPYGLDKLDDTWSPASVNSKKNMKVVTSLPSGMRFDPEQGKKFYAWYIKMCEAIYRVLKPGAFFFSFSSPRLYHRMACAIEDAEFLVKDLFIWLYTMNQPKAMSLNHVINKLKITDDEKEALKEELDGWKTPQVKSCFEPIVVAQKPLDGSFLENYRKNGVGLVDTKLKIGDDMFVSNVLSTDNIDEIIDKYFLVGKPTKEEKGEFNTHKTVKPLQLCHFLISLTTRKEDVVLDPFSGSGTTLVAAKELGRNSIGFELNPEYVTICNQRLNDTLN